MNDYLIVKASDEASLKDALAERLSKYDNPDYRIINMEYVAGYYQMYIEVENPITLDDDIYVRDAISYTRDDPFGISGKTALINKKYIRDGYDILEVVEEKRMPSADDGYVQTVIQRRRLRRKKNH